jgi:hypothetical protein
MGKFSDDIMKQIQDEIDRSGRIPGSVEDLNKIAGQVMARHNQSPVKDFEGLSPHQMFLLQHKPFEQGCPVQFKTVRDTTVLLQTQIIRVSAVIFRALQGDKGIKLTPKGSLPRKLVKEIFDLDLYANSKSAFFPSKAHNETDFVPAAYTRALMKIAGLIQTRNNFLVITKKGTQQEPGLLFQSMFTALCLNFHSGYLDGFGSDNIGNVGSLYILYLLKRYGHERREASFYASLYFRAFPTLLNEIDPTPYRDQTFGAHHCYIYRTFEKGLFLFGLADLEYEGKGLDQKLFVKASRVFQEVFV